jgi:hypothetical protein
MARRVGSPSAWKTQAIFAEGLGELRFTLRVFLRSVGDDRTFVNSSPS